MNRKNTQIFGVILTILIITIFLSGCSEDNSSNGEVVHTEFLGTWIGCMEFSTFNFGGNMSNFNNSNKVNVSSSNITKLEFTKDTLHMTITTDNKTFTMPNSYNVEGDRLILSFKFTGEIPIERPDFNDGERPFSGERPPFDGERPSRTRSYSYGFNEVYNLLYLNGYQFKKVS